MSSDDHWAGPEPMRLFSPAESKVHDELPVPEPDTMELPTIPPLLAVALPLPPGSEPGRLTVAEWFAFLEDQREETQARVRLAREQTTSSRFEWVAIVSGRASR